MNSRNIIILVILLILGIVGIMFINNFYKFPKPSSITPSNTTNETNSTTAPNTCSGKALTPLTEGPYYKVRSPERQKISTDTTPGTKLILEGYVYNNDCQPTAGAWIDFWQTDGAGNYDNEGYSLRGYQISDEDGKYRLETVIPGEYPGRTAHIHFKIRASDSSEVITSQLFFPDSSGNAGDTIFDEALVVELSEEDSASRANYDFILP